MKEDMKTYCFAIDETISAVDIKNLRKKLSVTQAEFARIVNVSVKTVERWESGNKPVTGPITTLCKMLSEYPQFVEKIKIPPKEYPLRLKYMNNNELCTIIDVHERKRLIKVYNYANNIINKAFGAEEHPSYEQYEEFIESRCFPRERDKMKLILEDLELPFYDPLLIIEKTHGKMAEDNFRIEIER